MPNNYPIDAVNPEALRDQPPPPPSKQAPKRKLTMEEIEAQMRKANRPMPKKMAKGGTVRRGDGICKKGHTKGRML